MRATSLRTLPLLLALGLAPLGCGAESGDPDGGASDDDASAPGLDGGTVDPDGGATETDGGAIADDAGSPDEDAGATTSCPRGGLAVGDHELTFEHDGRTRRYLVHVPDGYDGSAPVPVVLNFHGLSSNASQQEGFSSMNDKADAEGFVAVHAEGTGFPQSWNGGLCCDPAAREEVDDVGFVRAMVDQLAGLLCVERSRVYATGFSNGGFLSHRLACEAADVIAAIAPVAGVMGVPMDTCTPARPIPVMHFHGTSDTLVPYEGSSFNGFPSVAETVDGWAARNGCTDEPASTYDMGDSHCETRDACEGGVEVTVCTVEGGGHRWPGGFGSGSTIVATDHMWDFLSRFSL